MIATRERRFAPVLRLGRFLLEGAYSEESAEAEFSIAQVLGWKKFPPKALPS
jgi:hypothetical protein